MNDPVKYALWAGCISLAIVVCCFTYVVWINAGSRNLALGLGALVGACAIFILQLLFEIRSSQSTADFVVELTIDNGTKTIRSTKSYLPQALAGDSLSNLVVEDAASKHLQQMNELPNTDGAPRIARDLAIVSIASFFLGEQSDWQLDAATYKTVIGTMSQWSRRSLPNECTLISAEEVAAKLKSAGNMFADIERLGLMHNFCAPPGYTLEIDSNSVVLRGFVSRFSIALNEPFASMSHFDPQLVAQAIATRTPIPASSTPLADGSQRYTNITITGRMTVDYSAYRAQQRDLSKYQSWATRIADGINLRFGLTR